MLLMLITVNTVCKNVSAVLHVNTI